MDTNMCNASLVFKFVTKLAWICNMKTKRDVYF